MEIGEDNTIVLVPIRSFREGKARLSGALDEAQRQTLLKQWARDVVGAAHGLPVWILTNDDEVTSWSKSLGLACLSAGVKGLNPAVTAGYHAAGRAGAERVIIAHADLPFADDLRIGDGNGVTIAPDRHHFGTNVMSLPANTDFNFAYGPNSFELHRQEADRLGLRFTVVDDPNLAWDVDSPDDLPPEVPAGNKPPLRPLLALAGALIAVQLCCGRLGRREAPLLAKAGALVAAPYVSDSVFGLNSGAGGVARTLMAAFHVSTNDKAPLGPLARSKV